MIHKIGKPIFIFRKRQIFSFLKEAKGEKINNWRAISHSITISKNVQLILPSFTQWQICQTKSEVDRETKMKLQNIIFKSLRI